MSAVKATNGDRHSADAEYSQPKDADRCRPKKEAAISLLPCALRRSEHRQAAGAGAQGLRGERAEGCEYRQAAGTTDSLMACERASSLTG